MIRPLRSELRRYAGAQPLAAFATVAAFAAVQVLMGMRSVHLYPDIAPDIYALASAQGSLAAAAQFMATTGGVAAAILVAYYGWIVDYQHGMMPTVLLFERRRWVLLSRKVAASIVMLISLFAVIWGMLWLAVVTGLASGEQPTASASQVMWPQVWATLGKSSLISFGYIWMAVLIACLTRRLVPTAVIMSAVWLATLPLTPISELRDDLPHVWIATWLRLPDNLQFVTYFWPSTQPVPGDEARQTLTLFAITAAGAVCAYLIGPISQAED